MTSDELFERACKQFDELRALTERVLEEREVLENIVLDAMQDARDNADSMSELPWWYAEAAQWFKRREQGE